MSEREPLKIELYRKIASLISEDIETCDLENKENLSGYLEMMVNLTSNIICTYLFEESPGSLDSLFNAYKNMLKDACTHNLKLIKENESKQNVN